MTPPPLPLSLALAAALASSAATAAEPPKPKEVSKGSRVVLVLPFADGDEVPDWTGFAMQELVTDLFAQQSAGSFISSKQLDSVLRRKDLQLYDASDLEVALPVGKALGVTDLIAGEIRREGGKTVIAAQRVVVGARRASRSVTVSGGSDDLPVLAAELAEKLLDVRAQAGPLTRSAKALEQAALCWTELVRYPLQPRVGAVPTLENAKAIEGRCRAALAADPQLGWARAGVAVLKATNGKVAEARAESKEAQKGRFSPWGLVAESYVARRAGDAAGARAALEVATKERPGFLLALGYLAEERMEAEDWKSAIAVWDRYLKRAPNQPFVLGQLAKCYGYLGRHRDALALTRRGLDFDPGDPELLIELGSRLIDAGQDQEAEASLRQAMEARPPRPLAWLRLGYLYLKQGRTQDAHDLLVEAVTFAYREDEGRTRGVAFADLAVVSGKLGNYRESVQYLDAARAEGNQKLPCEAEGLLQFKGKPEFDALCGGSGR